MKSKKILVLLGVLCLGLSSIHGVKAETEYENSDSSVSYASGDVETDSEESCEVLVSQGSTFSVSIPKFIVLNGYSDDSNSAEYTISTYSNIASDEVLIVQPLTESFEMKDFSELKTKTAYVSQSIYKFVESETKAAFFSSNDEYGSIDRASDGEVGTSEAYGEVSVENLTAGEWSGTFVFNIELTKAFSK